MLQSIHFQDVGLCFKEILVKFTLILTLAKSGALANSSSFFICYLSNQDRYKASRKAILNTGEEGKEGMYLLKKKRGRFLLQHLTLLPSIAYL